MTSPKTTKQAIEKLEAVAGELTIIRHSADNILNLIRDASMTNVPELLWEAAMDQGMPKPVAGEYAAQLDRFINDVVTAAQNIFTDAGIGGRSAGSAQHVLAAVPHRTPQRLSSLVLG